MLAILKGLVTFRPSAGVVQSLEFREGCKCAHMGVLLTLLFRCFTCCGRRIQCQTDCAKSPSLCER